MGHLGATLQKMQLMTCLHAHERGKHRFWGASQGVNMTSGPRITHTCIAQTANALQSTQNSGDDVEICRFDELVLSLLYSAATSRTAQHP